MSQLTLGKNLFEGGDQPSPNLFRQSRKLRAPSLVMLIKRLIKAEAQDFLTMPGGGYIHVTSAFPLTHHYQAVLAWGP
jgi:hypothetical protein